MIFRSRTHRPPASPGSSQRPSPRVTPSPAFTPTVNRLISTQRQIPHIHRAVALPSHPRQGLTSTAAPSARPRTPSFSPRDKKRKTSVWSQQLENLVRLDQLTEARRWYNLIPPKKRSIHDATTLLKLMPVDEADEFYETLRKGGAEVNLRFYNSLIHKHVRNNNTVRGLHLFDTMRRSGLVPNPVTFGILAQLYVADNNSDKAMALLEHSDIIDIVTYLNVAVGFAKHGRDDMVAKVLDKLDKAKLKPDGRLFGSLLHSYLKAGFADKANALFEAVKTTKSFATRIYGPMIDHAAKEGKFERVEALFKDMRASGVTPTEKMYNSLLSANASRGNSEAIMATLETMQKEGLSTSSAETYDILLNAYIQGNNKAKVIDLMDSMCSHLLRPTESTWSALIRFLGRRGMIDKARAAFDYLFKHTSVDVLAFNSILRLYANAGDQRGFAEVNKLLEEAKVRPNLFTYHCALTIAVRAGDVARISEVLREMQAKGYYTKETELVIMRAKTQMGDLKAAEEQLYRAIKEGYVVDQMYAILIAALCAADDEAKVQEIFALAGSKNVNLQNETYFTMMLMFVRLGQEKKAFDLLDILRSSGRVADSKFYDSLLALYGELENVVDAEKVLSLMQSHNVIPTARTYNALLNVYAVTAQYDKAVALLEKMREKGLGTGEITYSTVFTAIKNDVHQRYERTRARESFSAANYRSKTFLANANQKAQRAKQQQLAQEKRTQPYKLHPNVDYALPDVTVPARAGSTESAEVPAGEEVDVRQAAREQALNKLSVASGNSQAVRSLIDEAVKLDLPLNDQLFMPALIMLSRRQNRQGVEELLVEVRQRLPRLSPEFYAQLLRFYAAQSDSKAIASTLEQMKKDGVTSTVLFSETLKAYAAIDDAASVDVVQAEMAGRGWVPDIAAFQALINMHLRLKNKEKLTKVLKQFNEQVQRPKLEDVGAVIRLVDKVLKYMKADKVEATQAVLFPLLFIYSHLNIEDRAETLYDVLLASNVTEPYVFNQMIVMYSRASNQEGVEKVVKDLERLKVKRNANTYIALVSYYALRAPSPEEEVLAENQAQMAEAPKV